MRRLDLAFVPRVKLRLIIGGGSAGDGGVDKLTALSAVVRKLEFTDDEWERISMLDHGASVTYSAAYPCPSCSAMTMRQSGRKYVCSACRAESKECPEPTFGGISIELEEAEAVWVGRRLREWLPNATVGDEGWFQPVMEALTVKAEPRMEFKRAKRR